MAGRRIASLLPSATEIVCAVGARAELVGISHECDFPESVRGLPVLTRPRLHAASGSRAIDRDVRAVLQQALAVYEIEMARLEATRPDVIVTQDLCDVCAVSFDDVRAAAATLVHQPTRIVNLHPMRLDDIWRDILHVAEALERASEGGDVVDELQRRASDITRRSAACADRPRVASIEWLDPVMIAGMWMPELIERAGGIALMTTPGQHAPTVAIEALRAMSPDVVLISPCGFPLDRTVDEIALLRTALPWDTWPAARNGRVYIADGNAYFNRPGPRIVESLEILAACLHPAAFEDFRKRHAGSVVRVGADLRQHSI
jgi:iron complex transport system substrate-binding protein